MSIEVSHLNDNGSDIKCMDPHQMATYIGLNSGWKPNLQNWTWKPATQFSANFVSFYRQILRYFLKLGHDHLFNFLYNSFSANVR